MLCHASITKENVLCKKRNSRILISSLFTAESIGLRWLITVAGRGGANPRQMFGRLRVFGINPAFVNHHHYVIS
jgi:hypothetical protein